MRDDVCPVQWDGPLAVIALPERVDVANAGQIREELLSVINRGAKALIADMTATISCDHAGADALVRAYQRTVAAGTELRLVVTAQIVARVLSITGLDRLVSIYPSLDAATAARPPAPVLALVAGIAAAGTGGHAPPRRARQARAPIRATGAPDRNGAVITPAVVWKLVDALQDGVALADGGGTIRLANSRLEEMFGYRHGQLTGRPVESLMPAHVHEADRGHRACNARAPGDRPMGAGAGLVGQRKDGTTFPAEISVSPVATPASQFALTVIRDTTGPGISKTSPAWPPLSPRSRHGATCNCWTRSSPACSPSASACTPQWTCPPKQASSTSPVPSAASTTPSARSATPHSRPREPARNNGRTASRRISELTATFKPCISAMTCGCR